MSKRSSEYPLAKQSFVIRGGIRRSHSAKKSMKFKMSASEVNNDKTNSQFQGALTTSIVIVIKLWLTGKTAPVPVQ